MRDNLKSSDERMKEAQHIAKLGSWEWNLKPMNCSGLMKHITFLIPIPGRSLQPLKSIWVLYIPKTENKPKVDWKCLQDHQPFSYELETY